MTKPTRRDSLADFGGGVDQIFGDPLPEGVTDLANARGIDVARLDPNPFQPRKDFNGDALNELADDIKEHGVLQPLLVRPHPDMQGRYQIVAGERRWRAAQSAGLGEVPCIERVMDDDTMERLALMENIQRTDLAPLDEAHVFQRLMERFDVSLRDLAARVHKHHEYVAQRLRLIKDPRIEALVRDDKMKPSTAQELVRVKDEQERRQFIERAEAGERIPVEEVRAAQSKKRQPRDTAVSKFSTDAADSAPLLPVDAPLPDPVPAGRPMTVEIEEGTDAALYQSFVAALRKTSAARPAGLPDAPVSPVDVLRAIAAESERRPLVRADWARLGAIVAEALRDGDA